MIVEAPGGIRLAVGAVTDTGRKRTVNEDSYLAELPGFLVADGMGGYEAGDRASAAVVAAFRDALAEAEAGEPAVRDALRDAEARVAEIAAETAGGTGSTLTGVVLVQRGDAPQWLVLNIGDSRVYRWGRDGLDRLTTDHSLLQELIARGELTPEEQARFPLRNVITRAVGAADSPADVRYVPVLDGERLLVCSDGLHSELDDEVIAEVLGSGLKAELAAFELVARANGHGGRDNVTVVVVDVLEGGVAVSTETVPRAVVAGETAPLEEDTLPPGGRRPTHRADDPVQ
jgi:PPM family protein phosphatase